MNSNQDIPNESISLNQNLNPSINFNHAQSSQNINSSLVPKDISTITHIISRQSQTNENKNNITITTTQFEEKKYQSNVAPFKSFINEQYQISSNSTLLDNPFNKISSNPFSKKSKSEININMLHEHNPKASNDNDYLMHKTFENNCKINKSQITRNSFNINPGKSKELSNEISNGIIRIKVYRSHIKPKRATKFNEIENKSNIFDVKSEIKNDTKINNNNNTAISDFNDEKYKYRLLIKRIALQLKRKIKPPTKGYFYVSIIRTDKYMNTVKKIAKKMKNKICPPTHGFFYVFIEKQKQYKLLIKRIAFQLKKRIYLPTCKIIKIYESYRLLIKRIAISLRNSIKKEKVTCVISGNNNICNDVNNSNINKIGEINNANQEADTAMDIDIDVENNNNKKEVINKEEINSENKIQSLTFTKTNVPYFTQNISNNNSNYTFSKMGIIQEEIPKSAEQNKKYILKNNCFNLNINNNDNENNDKIEIEQMDQIKKIEKNQKESTEPMKINTNFIENDLNQEIINKTQKSQTEYVLKEQEEKLVEEKIIERKSQQNSVKKEEIFKIQKDPQNKSSKPIFKNIRDSNYIKSVPCLTKQNKNIYFNMTLFTKENLIKENEERKIHNKSHSKNNINFNLNNFTSNLNYNLNSNDSLNQKDNIQSINENITLTEIETGKPNFINKFQKFLVQEKIEIVDNFPISLNESHKTYFQQSNFWYLIICYIFYINNNLSLYSIIHLLEQYNIWTNDKNEEIFYSLKEKIIEYINNNYTKEIIKQFLYMNKFKDINQIFEKFENVNGHADKISKIYEYKEIKVDNINILHDGKNLQCKCDLCTSDEACIKKVGDLNKNRIHIVNDSNINIEQLSPEKIKQNIIEKVNNNNMLHNNEELFYKGLPKKKTNNFFSKSKTIIEEKTNIEYNYLPKLNKEKNSITNNPNESNNNNIEKKNNNDESKNIIECPNNIINESCTEDVEHINHDQEEIILESEEKKKSFKNISKMKPPTYQENKKTEEIKPDDISVKSEKKEENEKKIDTQSSDKEEENDKDNNKEEEKEEKEKEEDDSGDEDNKSNAKDKKSRKGKSRKKNKKKKEFTKIKNEKDKEKEKEENENDEKTSDEIKDDKGEEKSYKKKKKNGSTNVKKKNKSKVVEKNEDEKKYELEEMLKEDGIENEKMDENGCDNNSNRKKTKSPNKKKNKKH